MKSDEFETPNWEHFGERLRLARNKCGFSYRGLSKATGVSHEAIRLYENGKRFPDDHTLDVFCQALEVTRDYLLSPVRLSLGEVSFRAHSRSSGADRAAIRAELLELLERYLELEDMLELDQQWETPKLEVSSANTSDEYAEEMALALRRHWDLGLQPIYNLTKLLEEKGLKVLIPKVAVTISGLTCEVHREGGPSVFTIVVNQHHSLERRRFTLAHELGHRLLDCEGLEDKKVEHLCNRFAAAFLVPRATLEQELGTQRRQVAYEEIMMVKKFFRVSAAMIVMRLEQVGIFDLAQRDAFFYGMGQGWRTAEPEPLRREDELPRYDRLVYRALASGFITLERASELLDRPFEVVERGLKGGRYGIE